VPQISDLPELPELEPIDSEIVFAEAVDSTPHLAADGAPRPAEADTTQLAATLNPPRIDTTARSTVESSEPTSIPALESPEPTVELPAGRPVVWQQFVPKTPGEALYAGVKEAVNTAAGNSGLMAVAAKVDGKPVDPKAFAVGALLGGGMAGAREGLLRSLPAGERLGYLHQPQNAPSIQRWIATTPITWSFYSMYFTLKDAIANSILGQPTPTELDPAHVTSDHGA
jgi:hypothetical protein